MAFTHEAPVLVVWSQEPNVLGLSYKVQVTRVLIKTEAIALRLCRGLALRLTLIQHVIGHILRPANLKEPVAFPVFDKASIRNPW